MISPPIKRKGVCFDYKAALRIINKVSYFYAPQKCPLMTSDKRFTSISGWD